MDVGGRGEDSLGMEVGKGAGAVYGGWVGQGRSRKKSEGGGLSLEKSVKKRINVRLKQQQR